MLTVVEKVDQTTRVPHDSIQITTVAGDPVGKATFQVIDPGSQINLSCLQEVIFIDEAATLNGNTLIPTHNYIGNNDHIWNNNFNYGNTNWIVFNPQGFSLTFPAGPYPTFSSAQLTMTASNTPVGNAQVFMTSIRNDPAYVITAGQSYCFSAQMNIPANFVNGNAFIAIACFDVNGNSLASSTSQPFTAVTSGFTRVSITITAPPNTNYIEFGVGIASTSATNSGSVSWTGCQCEPVLFPSLYSYPTPICDLLQADSVALPDGTTARLGRVFTGYISHLTASYEGTTRTWTVEATSLDGWLENITLVNASYSNVADQSIITGIVNNLSFVPIYAATSSLAANTPQALAFRNTPICVAGITVPSIQYADATVREVLNSLTDMTGFLFGIDPYYNVYYYPPFFNAAPYGFAGNGATPDNVSTFGYYDYSIEYDGTQIQNALNISGGTYQVQITENFAAGDGTHNQFIVGGQTAGFYLTYTPTSTQSSALPTVVFGGVTQSIILDTGAGFGTANCMLQWGNHIGIGTAINAGTSISVTYTYTALVYVQVEAPDSIASFGGRILYGKINDTNLASNAAAVTRGEAQLQAYAQPRVTLKFKTNKALHPGQVIAFTSTLDGLTAVHFTVQQVTATHLGDGLNQYEVQAGTYVDDFVDFFRNSQKAINRATHDPGAPFQQYNNLLQDSLSLGDSLSIHP